MRYRAVLVTAARLDRTVQVYGSCLGQVRQWATDMMNGQTSYKPLPTDTVVIFEISERQIMSVAPLALPTQATVPALVPAIPPASR